MNNLPESEKLRLLNNYLENYPYEGKLYFSYFATLVNDNPEYDFDDFERWFTENKESSNNIKQIFHNLEFKIQELIIRSDEEFLHERRRTKLLFPSVESLYTPVGMFDN